MLQSSAQHGTQDEWLPEEDTGEGALLQDHSQIPTGRWLPGGDTGDAVESGGRWQPRIRRAPENGGIGRELGETAPTMFGTNSRFWNPRHCPADHGVHKLEYSRRGHEPGPIRGHTGTAGGKGCGKGAVPHGEVRASGQPKGVERG